MCVVVFNSWGGRLVYKFHFVLATPVNIDLSSPFYVAYKNDHLVTAVAVKFNLQGGIFFLSF